MLPPNHPLRLDLANEVHARPTEGVSAPSTILYLVLASDSSRRQADYDEARALFERLGHPLPEAPVTHRVITLGLVRLVLERHSEFIRFMAVAPSDREGEAALETVAAELGRLTGQLLVATKVHVLAGRDVADTDLDRVAESYFGENTVVGSHLADGAARAITDFNIDSRGFSRVVFLVDSMRPRQCGRMVQRLLEIDTYRMMALLALPAARDLRPTIEAMDNELTEIVSAITEKDTRQEAALLERLTNLEARVQHAHSSCHYRFSASGAYHDLVTQRISDLREKRIEGLQTFFEFTSRRLAPAMNTCRATSNNLKDLSLRVAQATDLLATRVEVFRERQNRELLASMARRAKLQLRLQRTVEGLSIVAVSYYVLGLLSYVFKGVKAAGVNINTDLVTALAIPLVFLAVTGALKRLVSRHFKSQ
jgi:uncharacterized membrane-anchored protein